MKKAANIVVLFCCLAAIQIAVPVSIIVRNQAVLRTGRQFRFLTQPVDPYDAFRGRYVFLRFEQEIAGIPEGVNLKCGQKVYVSIGEDERGFAKITGIGTKRPAEGDYVRARVNYTSGDTVYIRFPFNRYYMEEKLAPAAESAYRKHSSAGTQDAYVTVRVKSGHAVIEEFCIAGQPILEFLRENP